MCFPRNWGTQRKKGCLIWLQIAKPRYSITERYNQHRAQRSDKALESDGAPQLRRTPDLTEVQLLGLPDALNSLNIRLSICSNPEGTGDPTINIAISGDGDESQHSAFAEAVARSMSAKTSKGLAQDLLLGQSDASGSLDINISFRANPDRPGIPIIDVTTSGNADDSVQDEIVLSIMDALSAELPGQSLAVISSQQVIDIEVLDPSSEPLQVSAEAPQQSGSSEKVLEAPDESSSVSEQLMDTSKQSLQSPEQALGSIEQSLAPPQPSGEASKQPSLAASDLSDAAAEKSVEATHETIEASEQMLERSEQLLVSSQQTEALDALQQAAEASEQAATQRSEQAATSGRQAESTSASESQPLASAEQQQASEQLLNTSQQLLESSQQAQAQESQQSATSGQQADSASAYELVRPTPQKQQGQNQAFSRLIDRFEANAEVLSQLDMSGSRTLDTAKQLPPPDEGVRARRQPKPQSRLPRSRDGWTSLPGIHDFMPCFLFTMSTITN